MTYQYSNPRASAFIPTDEIATVHFRRNSRRLSDLRAQELTISNQRLLESVKPDDLKDEHESNGNDDSEEYIIKEEYYSPEGTWGWVIVFAAFGTNFIVDGISLSYSVLTETLTETKNLTDENGTFTGISTSSIDIAQYNTIGSILLAVTLIMGPVASLIVEKFLGFRKTAMCGSVISTIGVFSSWLLSPNEPNFYAFLVGFGILTGIGFGILFTVSVVIVGLYFDKNRALATGITVAGTGVGVLVLGPVMNIVLQKFEWQGAVIFQGILCATSIFLGALYREVPKRAVKVRKSEMQNSTGADMPAMVQLKELLCSPSYLIAALSGSFLMMGYFAPFGFLVDSAAEYIEKDEAVFLLTYLGIANAVGRVFFGFLANKIGRSLHISNIALTAGGLVTILYPFANTHYWLILCSVVFGLYAAVFASLRSIVIMNIVGEAKFNVAFGLSLLFMGVATLFSNTLGGYLQVLTKTYDMSFYVAGGFIILSAAVCYPLPCIIRYEDGKKMDTFTEKQQRKSLVDVHVTN